jgi:hypothetical protein
MGSFVDLDRTFSSQPRALGAELARIDTGKGQERLFADQVPQLLRALSENARVASITASNAIENVTVAKDRAERIAEGSPRFRNAETAGTAQSRSSGSQMQRTAWAREACGSGAGWLLLDFRLAAPPAEPAAGNLERFDIDFILGASRCALHLDQVLERRNAHGISVEIDDVGVTAQSGVAR